MRERSCIAIILAAGEGKRMQSRLPKVMHQVAGRPMIGHVLAAASRAGASRIAVVTARHGGARVIDYCASQQDNVSAFIQEPRLGTAHAVLAAREALVEGYDDILVLFGDTPLIEADTLNALRARLTDGAIMALVGFRAHNPTGYGRVLLAEDGRVNAIREERDASAEEKRTNLCNAGVMAFSGKSVLSLLTRIGNDNVSGEYYLTDAVALARAEDGRVDIIEADEGSVLGVNSRAELAHAEWVLQSRLRQRAMAAGVTLQDPNSVYFCVDTHIAPDVVIEPNVVFGPGVRVGEGSVIRAFSHLEGADIGADIVVGPFARLRAGSIVEDGAKVGNFVEVKQARVGAGAKLNHLSYIGDSLVGARANIGAGTITCNYDGVNKHQTIIGDGVFVGSNSSLVAPVTIGAGAYIGSGSVISKDVAPGALAVSRPKQIVKEGWASSKRRQRLAKDNGPQD